MIRMLGQGVALTMVFGAVVACGGPSMTGPTTSATVVKPAVTELEGTVITDGCESTSATQVVSSA
jgi:hypothetical protein